MARAHMVDHEIYCVTCVTNVNLVEPLLHYVYIYIHMYIYNVKAVQPNSHFICETVAL